MIDDFEEKEQLPPDDLARCPVLTFLFGCNDATTLSAVFLSDGHLVMAATKTLQYDKNAEWNAMLLELFRQLPAYALTRQ